MFHKLKKSNSEGFTIIEVMIVLAVAALILLIVLLAIPALQRNARNTTIKNDVGTVAGGINTYESDNNGKTPTSVAGTGTVTINAGAGSVSETINVNGSTQVQTVTPAAAAVVGQVNAANVLPPGVIDVQVGVTCPASGSAVSTAAASARSVAVYYVTETTSGNILQCTTT